MMRTITPISSIILSISIYFFFVSPMYENTKNIREETDRYNDAAEEYDKFNQNLNRILSLKSSQNPLTIERLNQLVPKNIDSAYIIADLEVIAKDHGMLFGNISTETIDIDFKKGNQNYSSGNMQTQVSAELQTTDISFDLIGTYEQFQSFLIELESSLTLLEIITLEFAASDGLFEQFSMIVRAYALPASTN